MAKRKCRELKDLKVEFVSLVDKGANGKPFAMVKSEFPVVNFRKEEKKTDIDIKKEDEITQEDQSFLKKFCNFFKTNKQEEKTVDEKILEKLEDVNKSVKAINDRMDKLEKGEEEDVDTDNADTENNSQALEKMADAVVDIAKLVSSISKRVETLEKTRRPSKAIDKDNIRKSTKNNEVTFEGVF